MRFKIINNEGSIRFNDSMIGETIENKVRRVLLNNEPISDGAPLIFTDKKFGVMPEYDVRRDKFDIAIDAMDLANKSSWAKSEVKIDFKNNDNKPNEVNNNAPSDGAA